MKTFFSLVRIDTNSKRRYPSRKTKIHDVGFFSSLERAEKQLKQDMKECQKYERERQKNVATKEFFRKEEQSVGHDIVLAYRITEYELDRTNIQSDRTYTADGQINDICLLDSMCRRHFKGRTPEQIRFKPGDIVEVIDGWSAELCVVWHAQPTVDDYARYHQRCLEAYKKICRKQGVEYNEKHCPFQWDCTDDSYTVYLLGEGDTHFHPSSTAVFRPTMPVSKHLQAKFMAKYEEECRFDTSEKIILKQIKEKN